MKWTLIFTFLASPGHRFSPAFTQIAPLLLPLGPSCLNVLVGDNCELLDFMLFFSLFYNFNASYPTHTNIYWTKDCSPVVLHEQQSLWGPSPNCPLQGQQALYRPHFLWYNKQKRFDTLGPSALLFLFTLFPLCLVSFFIKQAGFHLKFVFYTQLYNISTHMEYILMLRLNADTAIATNSISPCFVLIQTLYDNMHCLSSVNIICNLCGARHSLQLSCVCVV